MSIRSTISGLLGTRGEVQILRRQNNFLRRRYAAIQAATTSPAKPGYPGISGDEDAANKEYLTSLRTVLSRSQDLDVNNPDVGGFHRTRVAQVLGRGVVFKHVPHHSEIGVTSGEAVAIGQQVNRLRQIHSRLGGFDASGNRRSEGKQQERALLTAFVTGCCLIHRVWRPDSEQVLPFAMELISGARISTPFDRAGDPLISYGIEYSDEHRTRVTGYHVRRVSATRGNSFVPDYVWDFLPVEDCSLLSLTEMAGLDRALPLSIRNMRMLHNRGEFIESAVESARAQANHYAVTECAEGRSPWDAAADDADQPSDGATSVGAGFTSLGPSVQMLYTAAGEKVTPWSTQLPDPDFPGFMKVTDSRCARGFVSSLSRFTREVNSSWAGGRLEDQQDDPVIDQYREAFVSAWQAVNEWFLEAIWLADAIDLPGYSLATRCYWAEFRATFPAKVDINPVQTATAREKKLMQRTASPQRLCEEDATDLRENLREFASAMKIAEEVEQEFSLKPHSLDILFSGKAMTSSAGADIAPAAPEPEVIPPTDGTEKSSTPPVKHALRLVGTANG